MIFRVYYFHLIDRARVRKSLQEIRVNEDVNGKKLMSFRIVDIIRSTKCMRKDCSSTNYQVL